jgi:hypothetical protein
MIFRNKLIFYGEELLAPRPTAQVGGPLLVGCPRLLIEYIRSYPPYLEVVSSIRNLRTRPAVVTRDPPSLTPAGYPLGSRLAGPPEQVWMLWSREKTFNLSGIEPWPSNPVTHRYTD